ncbi:deoxyribodipyrimidine photo-lyase [Opitutus sp. ER46]|uniref:cryptochrome/photolyase family protein n=1 Tax=Opitutus sp. ER46 TaxID=2161864 RepID=UPI000D303C04|nr:deoxyribodipyrimidine photo-lyase [Opitutus sp. ER46]PTX99007.1 deoxyribodipyrimidine photolyase [Opitutus sp. ER46]
MAPTLVWLRQDLRLQDHPALASALRRGGAVVPVYVLDDAGEGRWACGAAARSWLHRSLAALEAALRERGSRLILARGDTATELMRIVRATGAQAVYWSRRYEPAARRQDAAVAAALKAAGVETAEFAGTLLFDPDELRNKQGTPFQVFTPFWRHAQTLPVPTPEKVPAGPWPVPSRWPASLALAELHLSPRPAWDRGFYGPWEPGEAGGAARLKRFARGAMEDYAEGRDLPAEDGTSRMSPHLHYGEVSPRQVWAAVAAQGRESGVFPPSRGAGVFLNEIGWREFAHHLLVHFPHTPEAPLREAFARFPWAADPGGKKLAAWRAGRTGYPIVDAGMRQLWATGWMHNRVRMIAASFLVKHLRLPWTEGATWFWDTLVDADLAANTLNWQWSAGCGADAAPYFRIFAPVTQGRRFDPEGAYVRCWVPELARLPAAHVHAPWEAPAEELARAGVALGGNYPRPIVDHATARAEALAAFHKLRENGAG